MNLKVSDPRDHVTSIKSRDIIIDANGTVLDHSKGLTMIYALYEHQMAAREDWAQTLWANLNVNTLIEGIDGYLKELKKFPKNVRGLAVSKQVMAKMNEFKNSIPLFTDLKNDALRDRHWKLLMSKTGIEDGFQFENYRASDWLQYNVQPAI